MRYACQYEICMFGSFCYSFHLLAAPESKEQNNQQQVGNPDSEPPTPKSTQAAPQVRIV